MKVEGRCRGDKDLSLYFPSEMMTKFFVLMRNGYHRFTQQQWEKTISLFLLRVCIVPGHKLSLPR